MTADRSGYGDAMSPWVRRAGLLAVVLLAATGCDGDLGIDTNPCTGFVLYTSAEGCACHSSGDVWVRGTLWQGQCLHIE